MTDITATIETPQINVSFTGPSGTQGPQGIQGETGAQGPQGETGPAGADGADGADGQGVVVGGTTGQVLAKASDTDYDTEWIDAASGGGTSYPIALSGYRWRMRYDYAYSTDVQGLMYEYANNRTATQGVPDAYYFDSCITILEDSTAQNWRLSFIHDSTTVDMDFDVYIMKVNKTSGASSSTDEQLAKRSVDAGSLTSRRRYKYDGALASPITLNKWDQISVSIVQTAPNDTNYYYFEDLHLYMR